ncbi:Uncharacterised protein [Mycobacteroides abscessus subsp. abscessus]|nr:Uncharacterised protein [Mycobacteroides abscessus subsp. abscessus]
MSTVTEVANNQALARATARYPPFARASISATASAIRRPGRSIQARTRTGSSGTGPKISSATLPIRRFSRGSGSSSMALSSSAIGGEPCCRLGPHPLAVSSVDSNT